MNKNLSELIDKVVEQDYCIGCGICASRKGSPLDMKLNEFGKYRPYLDKNKEAADDLDVLSTCPFSNESINETELGSRLFKQIEGIDFDEHTGYFLSNYAAYVKEGEFRERGSSGGMGNWIAYQLIKQDLVDAVVHVKPAKSTDGKLFEFEVSNSLDDLIKGSKSKYYPIEMSSVIKFIMENPGRYALIAVPCFIKGIRLLQDKDDIIKSRIKFTIGLVCGHLKSDFFAKSLGWQMGINPSQLKTIDFRKKLKNKPASDYGVEATGIINNKSVIRSAETRKLYTTNWGHCLFKYNACDYCDDVLAETADVTVGDAWLPEYINDSMGTNIVIVRNPIIDKIVSENNGALFINSLNVNKVIQSQEGGFRHRREGLSYRLYLKDSGNEWHPIKRVEPSNNLPPKRMKIYKERIVLQVESSKGFKLALEKGEFKAFTNHMDPFINSYNRLVGATYMNKVLRKLKRVYKKIVRV